jgi:hypothetical protein
MPHSNEPTQRFALRRTRYWRAIEISLLYPLTFIINSRLWPFGILLESVIVIYWIWKLRGPALVIAISNDQISGKTSLLKSLQISKNQIHDISPSSKGLIISWQTRGVAHYTEIYASWFEDETWKQISLALNSWVFQKAPK